MTCTTITFLPQSYLPWRYALRLTNLDAEEFHHFLNAFKVGIPSRQRKWDAPSKVWLLRDSDPVIGLLERQGIPYTCETADDTAHRQAPASAHLTQNDAYQILFLRPGAPDFVISAVYRALAKQMHPDAGGSDEAMQRLNQAIEVLR